MVTGIDMREERISSVEAKRAGEESLLLIDRVSRVLTTVPVGTLDVAGTFERGADTLPTVNATAFAVDADLIDPIYEGYAEGDFSLGTFSLPPNPVPNIHLNSFLTQQQP